MLSLVTISPVVTAFHSCCLSHHIFWPSKPLAGLGRIWNRYRLTMLTWNRRDSTPLSAVPRAPKGNQGWISCVDKVLLSDGEKKLFKQNSGLISVIQILLYWKQRLRGGMLTLNAFIQIQMMQNTEVAKFSSCPRKHQNLHKLILGDHKLKLHEIAEELKISEGSVFSILHEHLSIRKLCSKWVQCLLTVDQKQRCIDDSEHCLQLFQCSKKEFFIDMLQWMKHGSTASLWTAEWTAAGESCPKQSDANIGRQGFGLRILFIDYLEKGRTINCKYHITFLVCLKQEIAKKWSKIRRKKCSFTKTMHCVTTMAKLYELHFELLLHPPYSLDLAPSNYWLFTDLKRMLQGKTFGSNEEVVLETEAYFEAKDKLSYKKMILNC